MRRSSVRKVTPSAWPICAFGGFDAFADETGRQAHLNGPIAAALMANAATLLAQAPKIEKVDLLAARLPG